MTFDLISDVHQDIGHRTLPGTGGSPVVVLAGDLHNNHLGAVEVLKQFADRYEQVLYVDGNHEFYDSGAFIPIQDNMQRVREIIWTRSPDNVHYLSMDGPFRCGRSAFIGVNGWYGFQPSETCSRVELMRYWSSTNTDCGRVFGGDANEAIRSWELDRENLNGQLSVVRAEKIRKIVAITHTIPTATALSKAYPPISNGAFLNGMADRMEDTAGSGIAVWAFGHTHHPRDYTHRGTRYVCNPRGYGHEGTGVTGTKRIEV